MIAFEINELLSEQAAGQAMYMEFLREPSMSVGVYCLPAGGIDPQQPHEQDELYYILHGRGRISVADEDRIVQPGSLIFVGKQVEHRFHSITEALQILVFFAPAESQ